MMKKKKKEGRGGVEEVLGMDYAQPRRNPPIHNRLRP
ncbi:unnamed protein product [Cuscuta epithymum]|nr:unnamed protein product [Cuscuta epithymum]CAH9137442.1 unnamed protein product [Cuscuta epithymum]